jgi:hypothetical protein
MGGAVESATCDTNRVASSGLIGHILDEPHFAKCEAWLVETGNVIELTIPIPQNAYRTRNCGDRCLFPYFKALPALPDNNAPVLRSTTARRHSRARRQGQAGWRSRRRVERCARRRPFDHSHIWNIRTICFGKLETMLSCDVHHRAPGGPAMAKASENKPHVWQEPIQVRTNPRRRSFARGEIGAERSRGGNFPVRRRLKGHDLRKESVRRKSHSNVSTDDAAGFPSPENREKVASRSEVG